MSSRYVRDYANKMTAGYFFLDENDIKSFIWSQATLDVRRKLRDKMDWAVIDMVARRAVKRLSKDRDLSSSEAKEALIDTYMHYLRRAEELYEEEENED